MPIDATTNNNDNNKKTTTHMEKKKSKKEFLWNKKSYVNVLIIYYGWFESIGSFVVVMYMWIVSSSEQYVLNRGKIVEWCLQSPFYTVYTNTFTNMDIHSTAHKTNVYINHLEYTQTTYTHGLLNSRCFFGRAFASFFAVQQHFHF